ncbi:ligase-associated DNA damage response endonuclease PdeM [Beijerinckia indica]|uniref:ligase-associated DNA damage response endonuclease PdeM n=1 Tax=Beijerinckia indica TaxID=533 RepID=UPI0005A03382|nr:ligase-associated DNA damage response endonuclease PdeM [Beijerinckia indica]
MSQNPARTTTRAALAIGDKDFVADPSGALFLEEERLLIVADLHLEKGSAYATRAVFLPPYDTRQVLGNLAALMRFYAPRGLIALGDSFHDQGAGERLHPADRERLAVLQQGREWIWISGNHDAERPLGIGGIFLDELRLGPFTLRHVPMEGRDGTGELAGHLHPVAKVRGRGGVVRRRCFLTDGRRCILPAFGAYAGGLNIRDEAFTALFSLKDAEAHVLGQKGVYVFPARHCLEE